MRLQKLALPIFLLTVSGLLHCASNNIWAQETSENQAETPKNSAPETQVPTAGNAENSQEGGDQAAPAGPPTEEAKPKQEVNKPEQVADKPAEPEKPAEPQKPAEPVKLPKLGASDTPMLPGQPWRVHDIFRPRPQVVAPPAGPVTAPPPGDALVLFDGADLSAWAHHDREDAATFYQPQWKVQDGYFEVSRGHGDLYTIENFSDLQMHIEWQIPENIKGSSQGRGNSGIKFLGLYEVQILDSYNNLTYADGQAAAIYGQYPPAVNASRKPGEWQTYDIIFEMPRFEGEKLTSPGYITVLHNGILVHHRRELAGVTGMASPGRYRPHPPAGPIMIQDHGNPIRFRNVWVRHLKQ